MQQPVRTSSHSNCGDFLDGVAEPRPRDREISHPEERHAKLQLTQLVARGRRTFSSTVPAFSHRAIGLCERVNPLLGLHLLAQAGPCSIDRLS
jgi:hypothetical protein